MIMKTSIYSKMELLPLPSLFYLIKLLLYDNKSCIPTFAENGTRIHNLLYDSYIALYGTLVQTNKVNICTHAMKEINLAELK
jgi:hypothetical protein